MLGMERGEQEQVSDPELVARCLGGDADAWEMLVERHASLVWAVARRAGLSPEDAADVFQNSWRVALEELPRLRDTALFGHWLGRVARHQCMRVRRGYGIARRARDRIAQGDVGERHPHEGIEALEERAKVAQAMERIGERCAELLRLLYYADPTPGYAEVAERLGMRIGSIGPTRARCLGKLQKELEA